MAIRIPSTVGSVCWQGGGGSGPKLCDFYVHVNIKLCSIGFFLSNIWLLFFLLALSSGHYIKLLTFCVFFSSSVLLCGWLLISNVVPLKTNYSVFKCSHPTIPLTVTPVPPLVALELCDVLKFTNISFFRMRTRLLTCCFLRCLTARTNCPYSGDWGRGVGCSPSLFEFLGQNSLYGGGHVLFPFHSLSKLSSCPNLNLNGGHVLSVITGLS